MIHSCAMRVRVSAATVVVGLLALASPALAQPGATGLVADLNAQAKALHESDPAKSLEVANQALQAARAAGDVRGEAEALNYVAYGHRQQSHLSLAREAALESARLYAGVGDAVGESQAYNTLGLIEADDGRLPDALEYHLKALRIREASGDREGLSYTFNNLGNIYRSLGDYTQALDYHQRGLELKIALGNRESEAYSHHNIGLVYFAMGEFQRAGEAYRRGLSIREELKDTRGIAVSLNAVASVEAKTNPNAALRTYQRVLSLRRQVADERGEMATDIAMADVYRDMGQPTDALAAYERALAIGGRIDAPLMLSAALKGVADIEAARGNFRRAYEFELRHHEVRDEMFNQENAARLARLQVTHETEQQERLIQLQRAELAQVRTMRTALAVTSGLVLLSLGLVLARYRLKQRSEARLKAQAEELQEALDRVQTLKGLLPICASCKKIRDDNGYWTQVEQYVTAHSAAEFTHSICPSCFEGLYPEGQTAHHEA